MRCHLMDDKEDVKCVMNEDLCRKLFNMSSSEGFQKLVEDPEGLKRKISEFSHLEGIFKIKLNPSRDNIYYNILDMYKNDSSVVLKKAYKELKETLNKFIKQ